MRISILVTFKSPLAVLYLGLALVTASAKEQAGGAPIQCGAGKVVLFDDATSKNGRYAIGWSLRPRNPKVKPVDWSLWNPDDPYDFLDKYPYLDPATGATAGAPYELFDCAVDLNKKRLLPLRSDWPFWPRKNHGDFQVSWNDAPGAAQYAIVKNDARFGTEDLWLIAAGDSGLRETELSRVLNKAVEHILEAKRPLNYARYSITWLPNPDNRNIFHGSMAVLYFSADIPKMDNGSVEGSVTVDIPRAALAKIECNTPRDDPFHDNPELAAADKELNRTYSELTRQLNETGRAALKKEQIAWLASRISGVAEEEDDSASSQARDELLIKSTKERTAELRKRLILKGGGQLPR